jgi:peptide/nickel transport system permease protein
MGFLAKVESNNTLRFLYSMFLVKKTSRAGVAIILCFVVLMLVGPLIDHTPPGMTSSNSNLPPSSSYLFGTDFIGHDIFSQVVWGAYPSLFVAISAALGAVFVGLAVGVIGGYFRRLEPVSIGGADIILTFPALPLLILIGSLYTVTDSVVALLLILVLWAPVARAIRSQVLSVKERPFVTAAKNSGMSDLQLIRRVIIPEVVPIAIAYFVIIVSVAIVLVTSLEFLGIGNPNEVSWGSMLYWAQEYAFFNKAWWEIVAPGLSIALVAAGFALIGFSVEEISDPRLNTQ